MSDQLEYTVRPGNLLDDQHCEANGVDSDGDTRFPGMTYEEGVMAAIAYAINWTDTPPMDAEHKPRPLIWDDEPWDAESADVDAGGEA